ncbi:MAG TPA: SMP-30/gluconolactonase/LRE family protein [Terriglobales bacterium]|nr:SMP-30/gluconolactonase/LRE family protein [Terriglobales bacterium]
MRVLAGFLVVLGMAVMASAQTPTVVKLDPQFDQLLAADAKFEQIAEGMEWSEGPVWDRKGGYLLFSDVIRNTVFQWKPGQGTKEFLKPSGYTGKEPFTGREPGSNGLTFDAKGTLTLCQHGDRRVAQLQADRSFKTLADRYEGKRFNSPNDLIFKKNGDLYFTDPPYGLPKTFEDPQREIGLNGVYRLGRDGKVTLLVKDMKAPNGIAFSPDEKTLYVSDSGSKLWMAFEVKSDGTLGKGRVLLDAAEFAKEKKGSPDGLKVDVHGNLWASGPGGIYVISPQGKVLGRIDTGVPTSNCAWGEDGSTFFITANHNVFRVKTKTKGAGW